MKTDYQKSIEALANLATEIEIGKQGVGNFIVTKPEELAKHIRKVLHGAR